MNVAQRRGLGRGRRVRLALHLALAGVPPGRRLQPRHPAPDIREITGLNGFLGELKEVAEHAQVFVQEEGALVVRRLRAACQLLQQRGDLGAGGTLQPVHDVAFSGRSGTSTFLAPLRRQPMSVLQWLGIRSCRRPEGHEPDENGPVLDSGGVATGVARPMAVVSARPQLIGP
ncbi:hypothetical protein [Streptomyces sp. NPDC002746]